MDAALAVTGQKGLAATVDDIATAAGVGRRTVFRYFGHRDELVAAACRLALQIYEEQVPRQGPAAGQDLTEWLVETATVIHHLNRHVLGRLFWDIHDIRSDLAPELAAAFGQRRDARQRWTEQVTKHAWRAAGGRRTAPRWIADTTSTLLSAFTTNAMAGDLERTPEEIAAVVGRVLALAYTTAVAQQSSRA